MRISFHIRSNLAFVCKTYDRFQRKSQLKALPIFDGGPEPALSTSIDRTVKLRRPGESHKCFCSILMSLTYRRKKDSLSHARRMFFKTSACLHCNGTFPGGRSLTRDNAPRQSECRVIDPCIPGLILLTTSKIGPATLLCMHSKDPTSLYALSPLSEKKPPS